MDLQLAHKTAVVSGSTAGIGYATALGLARSGAHVVVTGRTQVRVDAACATIGEAVTDAAISGFAADLTTAEGAAALVAHYPGAFSKATCLAAYA